MTIFWSPVLSASLALLLASLPATIGLEQQDLSFRREESWHKYVRSPYSEVVKPVRIVPNSVSGNVTAPDGLIHRGRPTLLHRGSESDDTPSLIVDMGQNVVGVVSITFGNSKNVSDAAPGLRLAFSETMEFLTNRSDFTRSDNAAGDEKLTQGTDQIAVKAKPYVWQDLHGCEHGRQVCSDGLHGFRYVKIWLEALDSDAPYTSSLGTVEIKSLDLQWSAYLGTPDTFTGWFECSDANLTQWWYDGVYTVDVGTDVFLANETEPRGASSPTLEGKQVLFDGAKRDRDPYVGDLAVASLTSYLSHDFAESTKNVLVDLALHQRDDGWIPPASINNYTLPLFDYPLWWVVCSVDLVMYTGDTSYAQTYWKTLTRTLDDYYPKYIDKGTNLLTKAAEMGYGDYAFLPRSGPVTYYNALYIRALTYAAELATNLGHKSDADRWVSRAKQLRGALMKKNFDGKVGAFYDGGPCPGQPAGTVCNVHSQDGNSLAILAGVTDTKTSKGVLDYWNKATAHSYGNAFYDSSVLSPDDAFADRVYAFISYFELEARFVTSGEESSAFDEIRRLYGWMAAHDPQITMWEGIGPEGSPYEGAFTSMAHGWSTGIVPLMSNHVLGVKPLEPGFRKWQVCPVITGGGLTWAKGQIPTPQGPIQVSWKYESTSGKSSASRFSLTVKAPRGTSGVICIPVQDPKGRTVKLDGRRVQPTSASRSSAVGGSDPKMAVAIDVQGGSHVVTSE